MFTAIRQAMQARAEARQARRTVAQHLAALLLRHLRAAPSVRQVALLQALALAPRLLPADLQHLVQMAAVQRLLALPVPPPLPSPGSPRSSSSRRRRGKSTTRRRR
jgi:hypothetical protein